MGLIADKNDNSHQHHGHWISAFKLEVDHKAMTQINRSRHGAEQIFNHEIMETLSKRWSNSERCLLQARRVSHCKIECCISAACLLSYPEPESISWLPFSGLWHVINWRETCHVERPPPCRYSFVLYLNSRRRAGSCCVASLWQAALPMS